jgi:hypothetical protein
MYVGNFLCILKNGGVGDNSFLFSDELSQVHLSILSILSINPGYSALYSCLQTQCPIHHNKGSSMTIDQSTLNKGQLRILNALRKKCVINRVTFCNLGRIGR